jgi:hypothetical protein
MTHNKEKREGISCIEALVTGVLFGRLEASPVVLKPFKEP